MKTVHLMIGIQGAGKTTYVKKMLKTKKGKDYKLVSTDLVRQENPNISEQEVWPLVYKQAADYLNDGKDVIFDATNITPKVRNRLVTNLKQYIEDFKVVAYYFPTHFSICKERVKKRNEIPGELYLPVDVCESFGNNIIPPTYNEKFSKVKDIASKIKNESLQEELIDIIGK